MSPNASYCSVRRIEGKDVRKTSHDAKKESSKVTHSIISQAQPVSVSFMVKCKAIEMGDEMSFGRIYFPSL